MRMFLCVPCLCMHLCVFMWHISVCVLCVLCVYVGLPICINVCMGIVCVYVGAFCFHFNGSVQKASQKHLFVGRIALAFLELFM